MVKAVRTSDETGMIVCQDTGICVFFVRWSGAARVNLVVSPLSYIGLAVDMRPAAPP